MEQQKKQDSTMIVQVEGTLVSPGYVRLVAPAPKQSHQKNL